MAVIFAPSMAMSALGDNKTLESEINKNYYLKMKCHFLSVQVNIKNLV